MIFALIIPVTLTILAIGGLLALHIHCRPRLSRFHEYEVLAVMRGGEAVDFLSGTNVSR